MSNFLQLCQKTIRDIGLDIDLSTVVDQSNMSLKIVTWVADADEEIQTKWTDWNFLWSQHSTSTIVGTREYSAPSDLGEYDYNSFYLDYTSDDYQHLTQLDYIEWREQYRQGTQTNSTPDSFIIAPNKNIYLEPIPDAVKTLTADYWKAPTRMTADADTSDIPTRHERIIIARAKIFYAEHDEIPTIFELATKEYEDLMDRLEAAELPGHHRARRKARNHDIPMRIMPR